MAVRLGAPQPGHEGERFLRKLDAERLNRVVVPIWFCEITTEKSTVRKAPRGALEHEREHTRNILQTLQGHGYTVLNNINAAINILNSQGQTYYIYQWPYQCGTDPGAPTPSGSGGGQRQRPMPAEASRALSTRVQEFVPRARHGQAAGFGSNSSGYRPWPKAAISPRGGATVSCRSCALLLRLLSESRPYARYRAPTKHGDQCRPYPGHGRRADCGRGNSCRAAGAGWCLRSFVAGRH